MNEGIGLVKVLSEQSDRFLFLLALGVLLWFAWKALMHQTARNDALVADLKTEQSKHEQALTGLVEQQQETNNKLVLALDHNTNAMNDCTTELRRCRENCTFRKAA